MWHTSDFVIVALRRSALDQREENELAQVLRPLGSFTFEELSSGEPWTQFPPEHPECGFVLNLTRPVPLDRKSNFFHAGHELAEHATAARTAIPGADRVVRVNDIDVPWDSARQRFSFDRIPLPESVTAHWEQQSQETELQQIKQSLVAEIDRNEADRLVTADVTRPVLQLLSRTLGRDPKHEIETRLASFLQLTETMIDADTWWTYDAECFGEGSGVALIRGDDVVGYFQLESTY